MRAPGRPLDAARAQLAYGEWLRRSQRRVDARQHLRQAVETFQLTGHTGQPGASCLRRDRPQARPIDAWSASPRRSWIAQLVSSGLSSKDVAARCLISPRTVAFHLCNIFAKAGITSRAELAQLGLA